MSPYFRGTRTEAGDPLPAGIISKAKVVQGALANLITLATSGTALALVPESARPYVLVGGAALTIVANAAVVFYATPTLTAPIITPDDDADEPDDAPEPV